MLEIIGGNHYFCIPFNPSECTVFVQMLDMWLHLSNDSAYIRSRICWKVCIKWDFYNIIFTWSTFFDPEPYAHATQLKYLDHGVRGWSWSCWGKCTMRIGVHECVFVCERGGCILHRKQETRSHNRMPQVFILYLMRGWLHGGNPFTKCFSSRRRARWREGCTLRG